MPACILSTSRLSVRFTGHTQCLLRRVPASSELPFVSRGAVTDLPISLNHGPWMQVHPLMSVTLNRESKVPRFHGHMTALIDTIGMLFVPQALLPPHGTSLHDYKVLIRSVLPGYSPLNQSRFGYQLLELPTSTPRPFDVHFEKRLLRFSASSTQING